MSDTDLELLARYAREGAEDAFAGLVRRHVNLVGGKLYSAPVIRAEIPDGKPQIMGSFTEAEARALAAQVMQVINGK